MSEWSLEEWKRYHEMIKSDEKLIEIGQYLNKKKIQADYIMKHSTRDWRETMKNIILKNKQFVERLQELGFDINEDMKIIFWPTSMAASTYEYFERGADLSPLNGLRQIEN